MYPESPTTPKLPARPHPENDVGIVPTIKSPRPEDADDITPENVDIFNLPPVAALKMLCHSVDALVRLTGDIPPTPPIRSRAHSPAAGASHRRPLAYPEAAEAATSPWKANLGVPVDACSQSPDHIDGVAFVKTPIGSPEAHPHEPTSTSQIIGAHAQPIQVQHGAIARKFYSKRPPPISLEDYLMRMHKYCPMSTAVYLAVSVYITRLAVHEKIIPVTPRNVHRLLLASLRVAMKALEDLSWPHARFSKVGGVSEGELGRLEITFCFLMNFTLKVDAAMLQHEAENLARQNQDESALQDSSASAIEFNMSGEAERKTRGGEKRKASSVLPSRPVVPVGTSIEVVGQS